MSKIEWCSTVDTSCILTSCSSKYLGKCYSRSDDAVMTKWALSLPFSNSAFICPLSDSESAALFEALAAEPNPSATAKVKRKLMSFIFTSECLFACDCMYIYRRCCGCGDGERSVVLCSICWRSAITRRATIKREKRRIAHRCDSS